MNGISDARLIDLAASMKCVAVTESVEVRTLVDELAPWIPTLTSCPTMDDLLDAIAQTRPDIAIVGPDFRDTDLRSLAAALKTSGLGLVPVGARSQNLVDCVAAANATPRMIEIEPFDTKTDGVDGIIRLRALLRRCRPAALAQKQAFHGMVLDEEALTLSIGDLAAPLSLEGFRFLAPMFDNPQHVWTREELLSLVYGTLTTNAIRTVDAKLNVTRRRLIAALGTDPVRTMRGQGYALAVTR